MSTEQVNGLYAKYTVYDAEGNLVNDPLFVIKFSDPVGRIALLEYARQVLDTNNELARDIVIQVAEAALREINGQEGQ